MTRPPLYQQSTTSTLLTAILLAEDVLRKTTCYSEIRRRAILKKSVNPMDITDTEFKNRYRLTKNAFKFLCEQLKAKSNLKASSRVSFELKVLRALSFYATGSYQRLVGVAKYLGQTAESKCVKEVTEALISPRILITFIKFLKSRLERDAVKNKLVSHEHYLC
ncbi:hypothetical protein SFRURICE_006311 [Spodoptera frugiperda]|nr:hypothetical protein SFRURICE_006311 [Spodoptera frugiperda]